MSRSAVLPALLFATFAAGVSVGRRTAESPAGADAPQRVFELRTYTTAPGRLPALQRRFREHTMGIFARHGMTNVGYWVPEDSARATNTLVYILAHPSRAEAARNWTAFGQDPEWQRVQAASEADGKIVEKVESVFLDPTDYSPIR